MLCKDQLAGKLAALFKEADPANIDGAVAQAKNQLVAESKRAKRSALKTLFDTQIATLKERECPEPIVGLLQTKRGEVVTKALKLWESKYPTETLESLAAKGIYLSLPVIPRTYLTIYSQMPMVRNGSKMGYTYLKSTVITDVVETPSDPYYIYDVEDGQAMCGKAPQDAKKLIKRNKRFGLTDVEVISLGLHTDVLSRHNVDAVDSCYGSSGRLLLHLDDDGQPGLSWRLLYATSSWGAASCGSR